MGSSRMLHSCRHRVSFFGRKQHAEAGSLGAGSYVRGMNELKGWTRVPLADNLTEIAPL